MERRKVCRYFERGACRKDNCPFVHLRESRKACQFYLKGFCRRGASCNFYHPPKEQQKLQMLRDKLKTKGGRDQSDYSSEEEPTESERPPHCKSTNLRQQEGYSQERVIFAKEEEGRYQNKEEGRYQNKEEGRYQNKEEGRYQNKEEDKEKELRDQARAEKIQKINFLLEFNMRNSSDDQSQEEDPHNQKAGQEFLQFFKIYPTKFVDSSKTPEMKAFVLANEAKYFGEKKFLDMIKSLEDPLQKEQYQIVRKFQDSLVEIEVPFRVYKLSIRPLLYDKEINLHFQFKESTLQLTVDAREYPTQRAIFTVTNQSIPEPYRIKFVDWINRHHAKISVFETLKAVQNGFEKMYHEAKFRLENQFFSRKENQRKMKQQPITNLELGNQPDPEVFIRKPRKEKVKMERLPVFEIRYEQPQKIDNVHLGYELSVDSLLLQNCQFVMVDRILLYLECLCEKRFSYVLEAGQYKSLKFGIKLKCRKCSNIMALGLQREIAQVKHRTMARIGVDNGVLIDVGGLGMKVGCNCDAQLGKNKLILPSQRLSLNCHTCFESMSVTYMGLKTYNPAAKTFQAQLGKELAEKGTCKHMRLSFRWFRFGCCGRSFSCDDCHMSESIQLHQKIKGLTMICGYCSFQQLVGPQCVSCKKGLAKGTDKGGHWEGGMGCRDQTLLSKKDVKKYTGLTKKKP